MKKQTFDLDPETTNDDIITIVLYELGLNEYESRAYLTVLESGVVVAREISDRASIPYAKVYQVLDNLIQKQLIIGDEGRPKKFRSKDPKDAFTSRLDILEKNWKKIHNKKKKIINQGLPEFRMLYSQIKDEVQNEQGVWTITGLSNIQSRLLKLLNKTESQIYLTIGLPELFSNSFSRYFEEVKDVKIFVKIKKTDLGIIKASKEIITSEIGNSISIIFDNFAHLSIIEQNAGRYSKGEFTSILTQINEIVDSLKIEFDSYQEN